MTEPIGKQIPRAKPIHLTFYDQLIEWPYRATFYVREETYDADCQRLIKAICAVSVCALGQYTIGYQKYVVPDYPEKLKARNPQEPCMGTFKWLITFRSADGKLHQNTIPGWTVTLALTGQAARLRLSGDRAYLDHPLWKEFLSAFTELCVTEEGKSISGRVDVDRTTSNWPPKGWKKRR